MSINRFIVMRHLGADSEIHYLPSGEAVARVRVATNQKSKNRTTGEVKIFTEWHRLVAFGKRAEVIAKFCSSGDKVYFEAYHRTRKFADPQMKQDHYVDEFVIAFIELTTKKQGQVSDPGEAEGGDHGDVGDIPF